MSSQFPTPPGFHPYYSDDYFYGSAGPLMIRLSGGRLSFGLRVARKHVNAAQICHGGALMFLMDMQLSLAATLDAGIDGFSVTVNMTSDFVSSARIGDWVQAESRLVKKTRSLLFAEGTLFTNGDRDALIMRANMICKIPRGMEAFEMASILPPEYVPAEGEVVV